MGRLCSRCVMDESDPEIRFDQNGHCNHCRAYDLYLKEQPSLEKRARFLEARVQKMKRAGWGKSYDCVIGMSGGVDSTYVAYLVKKLGLRAIAVHVDNGWNTELAVSNIRVALDLLGIDLHTRVLNWIEFRDLQLAFLKASVPDAEIPTDHAILGALIDMARQQGIPHVISGTNFRTEMILPDRWTHGVRDWRYIRAVHRRFGTHPLKSYPHVGLFQLLYYEKSGSIEFFPILDYIDYNKGTALETLKNELRYRPYEGKHHESIYTRFFQSFILPRKFGIDKRRAHLSCLVCSGEIPRDAALRELEKEIMPERRVEDDRQYVIKKLGISETEFQEIMASPPKSYRDFPTGDWWQRDVVPVIHWARKMHLLPQKRMPL